MIKKLAVSLVMAFFLSASAMTGAIAKAPAASAAPACVGCWNPMPPPKVPVGSPIRVNRGGVVYSCQLWYATLMGEYSWVCRVIAIPQNNWAPWGGLW